MAWLLVPVMFLPIAITILFLFAHVFILLGDAISASILNGTALALAILWCVSLVLLLICTVLQRLRDESES